MLGHDVVLDGDDDDTDVHSEVAVEDKVEGGVQEEAPGMELHEDWELLPTSTVVFGPFCCWR